MGFTLIELLVVISVIGFLASSAMVLIRVTQIKARNVRRNGDIVQLIKAFRLAEDNAGGVLPTGGACVSNGCTGIFSPFVNIDAVYSAIAPYIQKPSDSSEFGRTGSGYIYSSPASYYSSSPGSWLSWLLEPVANVPGVCGPGSAHLDTLPAAILCDVKID
ncbi:MAG: hypothetical protein UU95_C0030G0005 [Parcubacteria group bacterium GW2011_GWC2_42_12]|nr:MAG: hypothetical protein UU95_C0030G0005 [Parcubacteria group bacterium GW2011_GWC2_42_12]KKT45229.1 MAG: hypothetical protein UW34_C0002G0047 [Parcubacteria group bacterium GW2011_GWA2_44_15]